MKALLPLSFLAALVAFLVFPLSFEVAGSLLCAAAMATIAISDYARRQRRRMIPARVAAGPHKERFGLAA